MYRLRRLPVGVSTLPPVRQISGGFNPHRRNGVEAGHGTACAAFTRETRRQICPQHLINTAVSLPPLRSLSLYHASPSPAASLTPLLAFCLFPSVSRGGGGICVVSGSAVSWAVWQNGVDPSSTSACCPTCYSFISSRAVRSRFLFD